MRCSGVNSRECVGLSTRSSNALQPDLGMDGDPDAEPGARTAPSSHTAHTDGRPDPRPAQRRGLVLLTLETHWKLRTEAWRQFGRGTGLRTDSDQSGEGDADLRISQQVKRRNTGQTQTCPRRCEQASSQSHTSAGPMGTWSSLQTHTKLSQHEPWVQM